MIKILAIDDDLNLLNIYKETLKPLGCQIDTAEDAISAISLYHKTKPHLILLDIKMPAGGGLKFFEMMRSQFGDPTPIIFITGLPPNEIGSILKADKVFYLKKPFTKKQLLSAIRDCLFGKIPPPPSD
jgi:CheY-like chemotaxis protein